MSRRQVVIVTLSVACLFLFNVLTVESHANDRGDFASRCPTFVETGLELAVDASFECGLDLFDFVGRPLYFTLPLRRPRTSRGLLRPSRKASQARELRPDNTCIILLTGRY